MYVLLLASDEMTLPSVCFVFGRIQFLLRDLPLDMRLFHSVSFVGASNRILAVKMFNNMKFLCT
jgi:hypothetical protein